MTDLINRADAIAAFYDDENIPTQIVRDIIRAMPAYEVAVRELEWVEIRPECYFESRAIGILYSVRLGTDGIARWQAGHMATWHDADSLEAAKAAAQADYDARIQSALIVTHTGIAASQTPDPVTNADSCQPTRTYEDGVRAAAAVAAEYARQPATGNRDHDAGWDNAAICIDRAILALIKEKSHE